MKIPVKIVSSAVLIYAVLMVMLISGCGSSNEESKNEGCPSGSFLANSDDIIIGPDDDTVIGSSPGYGFAFPGGSMNYAPVVFTVTDKSGAPRNRVCLILYTDGFWWTDLNYTAPITGTGLMNTISIMTDDYGTATLYWSTEVLPSAMPATNTAGAWTAGADISGDSWIKVYSGVKSVNFTVTWTVEGEPVP